MTLQANVQVKVGAKLTGAATVGENAHSITLDLVKAFADGAGLNQAEQVYAKSAQLAASGVDSLDLSGALTNGVGASVAFTKIKVIIITAATTNQSTITVGGNAAAFASFLGGATQTLVVRPGGVFVLVAPDAAGYAVTASTADVLDITNDDGSNAADYSITLIGAES